MVSVYFHMLAQYKAGQRGFCLWLSAASFVEGGTYHREIFSISLNLFSTNWLFYTNNTFAYQNVNVESSLTSGAGTYGVGSWAGNKAGLDVLDKKRNLLSYGELYSE